MILIKFTVSTQECTITLDPPISNVSFPLLLLQHSKSSSSQRVLQIHCCFLRHSKISFWLVFVLKLLTVILFRPVAVRKSQFEFMIYDICTLGNTPTHSTYSLLPPPSIPLRNLPNVAFKTVSMFKPQEVLKQCLFKLGNVKHAHISSSKISPAAESHVDQISILSSSVYSVFTCLLVA